MADLIPDTAEPIDEIIDRRLRAEHIGNSGLTGREREVFTRLTDGYTVREIGRRMGISHVMVLKIKKNILKKVKA